MYSFGAVFTSMALVACGGGGGDEIALSHGQSTIENPEHQGWSNSTNSNFDVGPTNGATNSGAGTTSTRPTPQNQGSDNNTNSNSSIGSTSGLTNSGAGTTNTEPNPENQESSNSTNPNPGIGSTNDTMNSGPGTTNTKPNPNPGQTIVVNFKASGEDFPNPERGFFAAAAGAANVIRSGINTYAEGDQTRIGDRLVHYRADLSAYRGTATLPESYKTSLREVFKLFRDTGIKAVIRFSYNQQRGAADAPLDIVKSHIDQLGAILQENADVVALVEAGFIGAWGEWHSSTNNLDSPSNRIIIRDRLLAAMPKSRQISVRNPSDVMTWYPTDPNLNDLLAGNPKPEARIGFHNDCFLADTNDLTYTNSNGGQAAQRAFMKKRTGLTVSGGETCTPQSTARKSCNDILREGAEYHMTYLSRTYHQDFINTWKNGGCYTEVSKKLGYRLVLQQAEFDASGSPGHGIFWSVQMKNDGWARPLNARLLVLRLQSTQASYDISLPGSDLRRASPGESLEFSGTVTLPQNIPAGTYSILLGAPDLSNSIKNAPRFSIRFANADDKSSGVQWDAKQGFLNLGRTLTVN